MAPITQKYAREKIPIYSEFFLAKTSVDSDYTATTTAQQGQKQPKDRPQNKKCRMTNAALK